MTTTTAKQSIPRVAPKAYDYVKEVLDFGFHNSHSVGIYGRLQAQFAHRFGRKYALPHANGTSTMQTALLAADVGVGDEVIVPAYTVFSTPAAVLHVNAVPIIADVDPDTWTIDVEDIKRKITPNTKAIIPVSICGLSADLDPIMQLAREHNLLVIEDNAQCFLGKYKDRLVGSIGHFASFSFQSSKHMTCGDGGILVCDDDELAHQARKAAVLGYASLSKDPSITTIPEEVRCRPDAIRHDAIGHNERLPEIAAAVALAELERLDDLIDMRCACAALFQEVIADCDWLLEQKTPEGYEHAYWVFPVRITRDDIDWVELYRKFNELGGDGFYVGYRPVPREPVFPLLYEKVQQNPERYPQWAGRLPNYGEMQLPVWDKLQPRIIQFKTNYFDLDDAKREADILAETIRHFA